MAARTRSAPPFFGGGLSGFEMNALYAALRTYLIATGAWL